MRVLMVVGRPPAGRSPSTLIPASLKRLTRSSPSASSPRRPTGTALPPRATMLRATFPAPPGEALSRSIRTTGTGASGEIRPTLPQRKRSTIRSPRTTTRASRKRARMASARRASRSAAEGSTRVRVFLRPPFGLDGRLLDQHDRDVIDDRITPVARDADEPGFVLGGPDFGPAQWTCEDLEKRGIDGHEGLLRVGVLITPRQNGCQTR